MPRKISRVSIEIPGEEALKIERETPPPAKDAKDAKDGKDAKERPPPPPASCGSPASRRRARS